MRVREDSSICSTYEIVRVKEESNICSRCEIVSNETVIREGQAADIDVNNENVIRGGKNACL